MPDSLGEVTLSALVDRLVWCKHLYLSQKASGCLAAVVDVFLVVLLVDIVALVVFAC